MELREIETTITYECRKIRILKIKSYKKKTTPNINAITKVFKLNKLHKTSKHEINNIKIHYIIVAPKINHTVPKLYETRPQTNRGYLRSILGAASLDISKGVNPWFLIVELRKRARF